MAKVTKKYALWLLLILIGSDRANAQFVYVNAYTNPGGHNAIYKIDVQTRAITDSIVIPVNGEFLSGQPVEFRPSRDQSYLISVLHNGLSGKNSVASGQSNAYYSVVSENQFSLFACDSLPGEQITSLRSFGGDTLRLSWIGSSGEWNDGLYRFNRTSRKMSNISRRELLPETEEHQVIGNYVDPLFIGADVDYSYYVDLVEGHVIHLFAVNQAEIERDIEIGDLDLQSNVFGFDSISNKIYLFKIKFIHYSSSPPFASPDSLESRVLILNTSDFSIIESIPVSLGDAYVAQEIGKAEYYDGSFVFSFMKDDGYRRYDPAYFFIFDTRTNETTWLRVGWR